MPIAKKGESSGINYAEQIPADTYNATCVAVIDLGTQPSNNTMFADKQKIRIVFEIPDISIPTEDGGTVPAIVGIEFSNSLHEKSKLRPFLETWRGLKFTEKELEGFDLGQKLLGQSCSLSVVHETVTKDGATKTYVNVGGCLKLAKGTIVTKHKSKLIDFDLTKDKFKQEDYDSFPEFVRKKITLSPEYQALFAAAPAPQTKTVGGATSPITKGNAKPAANYVPADTEVEVDDDLPF